MGIPGKAKRDRPEEAALGQGKVLLPSLASGLMLWCAFPPVGLSLLAWVAPLGWLSLVDRSAPLRRLDYVLVWLSGSLFWLLILQGVRLAFWPLYFGWLALAFYLAVYTPLFVGVARVLVHRWRVPIVLAAPVAWVGMEHIRSYLLTGFAANTLAHSQVGNPVVIQLADQTGGGGVSFIMMLVAVCLGRLVQSWRGEKIQLALPWMGIAAASLIGLLGYGQWRLSQADRIYASSEPLLRVLLVQENTPTIFEINPERNKDSWARYVNLTRQAIVENGPVDLVVWPESTFTANEPWMEIDTEEGMSQDLIQDGITEERLLEVVANYQEAFQSKIALVQAAALGLTPWEPQPVDTSPPHLLLGSDAIAYTNRGMERYNAALFVDPEGKLAGRYGKMHLVMFGEYIPLGWVLQWLRDMFGLHGINAGDRPHSFPIQSSWVAPNICFESMVPHLIARHVRQLAALDQGPDVLINISNDSWFRGSALLDHHLACSILCAVENRRPMLVAANTGISAHISGSGRVIQRTDRLKAQALVAEPRADNRSGLYQDWGAALGWACAWACGAALLTALFNVISASYGRKLEKKPQFG